MVNRIALACIVAASLSLVAALPGPEPESVTLARRELEKREDFLAHWINSGQAGVDGHEPITTAIYESTLYWRLKIEALEREAIEQAKAKRSK